MLDIKPTQDEIDYLINVVNEYFPNSPVSVENHLVSSFAAVRPLVRSRSDGHNTSRNHRIYHPQPNIYVLVGGKYTTFRKMAQDLNKIIFKEMGIKQNKTLTLQPLRTTSIVKDPFGDKLDSNTIDRILSNEYVQTREDLLMRRLSLPTLKHLHDDEIENYISNLELKSKTKSK